MSLIPVLSSEEFTSLVKISFGPIQDAQIPSEHLLKLVGLQRNPSLMVMARIADALSVRLTELLK